MENKNYSFLQQTFFSFIIFKANFNGFVLKVRFVFFKKGMLPGVDDGVASFNISLEKVSKNVIYAIRTIS